MEKEILVKELRNYLSEEFDREFEEINDFLAEAYYETQTSFDLLENYFNAYAEYSSNLEVLTEVVPVRKEAPVGVVPELKDSDKDKVKKRKEEKEEKEISKEEKKTDSTEKAAVEIIHNLTKLIMNNDKRSPDTVDSLGYTPENMFVKVQKISDMKFPSNVIFFIKQLVLWCKNLVLAFISKITNLLRRLVGLEEHKDEDIDLKLNLKNSERIEAVAGFSPVKNNNRTVEVITVKKDDIKNLKDGSILKSLFESENLLEKRDSDDELEYEDDEKKRGNVVLLKVDVSSQLDNLEKLITHFFNIFDSSYGSNGEHLFKTQDLEILLGVFDKAIKEILSGNLPSYELQGRAVELVAVDKERLRTNLEKTLINTNNLKKVYAEIVSRINNTLKIITQKQLLASADMGVAFRFYSASTYKVMYNILQVVNPRIKEAEKLEKNLTKMKETYENLTIKLGELQQTFMAMNGVAYETIAQRSIRNLFDSARVTTQTVTMRLTTLSLYLKTLKDIRESIVVANAVNENSKNALSDAFKDSLDLTSKKKSFLSRLFNR